MAYQFANNASSVLTAQLLAGGTTVNITPADASKFPIPSGAAFFMGTLQKNTGEFEIVRVTTNPLTGAFTITRAQEGTAALQFEIGDHFSHRLTAGALGDFAQKDDTVQAGLNAEKVNGIEAATVATPNRLLALNGSGLLPAGITGNAATATNASNLGGQAGSYYLDRVNHTGGSTVIPTMQSFTASGTWTRPNGCVAIKVTVVGGGGSGGAVMAPGGPGGLAIGIIDVSGTSSLPVVVGAGGLVQSTQDGGASSIGSISATGGQDGNALGAAAPGIGSGGAINTFGPYYEFGRGSLSIGTDGFPGIVIVEEFY